MNENMSDLYRFKTTALLVINFILVAAQLKAQISGTVFRDYNGDGIRQTTSPNFEPGVAAINIKAYDADGTLVSTSVSANDGSYSMPFTVSVRVEFSIPNTNACVIDTKERTGFSGDGNNIRFVDATTSTLNYGILFPDDFTPDTNPMVFVPVYHAGDPLAGGDAGTINGFNGFTYNSDQIPSGLITASANNIGTVWGVAYSKQAKKVFTSAFIKRQAGLGPLGSGGIYMLEPTATSFNVTQFYDMDANGYRTRASASALPYGQNDSYTVDNSGYTIT